MIGGGIAARVRSLWRGLRRRSDIELEMNEEFRLHQELRAADLVLGGLSAADAYPVQMAVNVRGGNPASLVPRVRAVAADVDPALRLDRLLPIDELSDAELQFLDFWFRLTVLVSVMTVILSLAGIYAVMSFTVARRTREIGIRIALGSDRRRIILSIFARPLTQVGLGVVAGGVLVAALLLAATGGQISPRGVALLLSYAAFMLGVCMLACVVPTRRALRVEPTEALRSE